MHACMHARQAGRQAGRQAYIHACSTPLRLRCRRDPRDQKAGQLDGQAGRAQPGRQMAGCVCFWGDMGLRFFTPGGVCFEGFGFRLEALWGLGFYSS